MAESISQPLSALSLANGVRLAGAEVKRELKAGRMTVAEALADDRAGVLTVFDVLAARPRWGHTRVEALLSVHAAENPADEIGDHRRIRELTPRQVTLLTKWTAEASA